MSDWHDILQVTGYPTQVVVIDFETYFDDVISLSKQSTVEHVMDERFEILGASIHEQRQRFDEFRPQWWNAARLPDMIAYLQREYGQNLEGCTLVAHNAYYECLILALLFGIHPPHVVCTLGLDRHFDARADHDLGTIAKREGLPVKGDTKEFKHWTWRTRRAKPKGRGKKRKMPRMQPKITTEMEVKLADYCDRDIKIEWGLFQIRLPQMSRVGFELRVMQNTIELYSKPRLGVDFEFGEWLASEYEARVVSACKDAGHEVKQISGTKSFTALFVAACEAGGIEVPWKPAKNAEGRGLALAADDPEREVMLACPDTRVRLLAEAKVAIASWRGHATRVRSIMAQAKAAGGLLCVPVKYHGAHTGRESGGEKINLQNLPARSKHEIINRMRELLIAPPGMTLVIVDAAQIEGRGTSWIAGEQSMIDRWADPSRDIYCEFAAEVLGHEVPPKGKWKLFPAPRRKVYAAARQGPGKIGILGCGYGMGPAKAIGFAKGSIDLAMATKIVKTWRRMNPKTVGFWTDIEDAFAVTTKYGERQDLRHGLHFFQEREDITTCVLPSGRYIRYHKPVARGVGRSRTCKIRAAHGLMAHIWGGHFTENVVQAMSRDLLVEASADCEAEGIPILLRVHDELIGLVPEEKGEWALERMIHHMSRPRDWCPGWPLAAEGHLAQKYGK